MLHKKRPTTLDHLFLVDANELAYDLLVLEIIENAI
jgi:hypothetical protein